MQATSYRCGEFQVDLANRRFSHRDRDLALEPRVFAVVAQLLAKPAALITRNELLDAVWGHRYVTPSTLNRTIALARRAFDDDAKEPQYIQTVHGAGYRYIGPVEAQEPTQFPLAHFAPPPVAQLPARIDVLIGRETELAALGELLARHRAVTVLGPGGMGKTQSALEAARRAAHQFKDGVWFFDLVPFADSEDLLRVLGAAFELHASTSEGLLSKLCATVRGRQALLVLDNCDRIAAQVGTLVFELLRSTDSLKILATSQVPLNFAGERVLRIPPLGLPPREHREQCSPETVARSPAVELLLMRVRAVRPEFELTSANAPTLAEICIRLDGMPLALELVATRFALLSPEQVLERLVQRARFVGSDSAGRDPRHRNLQTLLEWSYGLLSADEQRVLNWSAVFVPTWTVEAMIRMAGEINYGAEATVDLLTGLVNHSLVSVVPQTTPPRYRLLETVRDYALACLRRSAEEIPARDAHLRVITQLCQTAHADMLKGHMGERVQQLVQERGNIDAALEKALHSAGHHTEALKILGSLVLYAKGHGDYARVLHWCRTVFAKCARADSPERARALLTYGVVQVHCAVADTWSETPLPEAAEIAARNGDGWTEAYARGYHALGLANWGHPDEARANVATTDAYAVAHDDALLRGLGGLAHSWVALAEGDPRAALDALIPVRGLGIDLHQQHFISMYIALARYGLGDLTGAAREWLDSMSLSIALGNIRGTAGSIEGCAYLACKAGNWTVGARMLAAARKIREQTEIPIFNSWRPYQESALASLRAELPAPQLAAATQAGLDLRHEDSANEARSLLNSFAGNPERRAAQRATNLSAGS